MSKQLAKSKPFATVQKAFRTGGKDYAVGDRFPKHGEDVSMDTAKGMVAAQMIILDRIPGPGQKLGQGHKNPDAIRREANAEPKSNSLAE